MEFSFKLPPGWQSRKYNADVNVHLYNEMGHAPGYQFSLIANPKVYFCISEEQLDYYADEPEALVMLMRKQIDQYQMAQLARAVTEHKKQTSDRIATYYSDSEDSHAIGECKTPYYCHWRRKNNGYVGRCDMCDAYIEPALPKKQTTLK